MCVSSPGTTPAETDGRIATNDRQRLTMTTAEPTKNEKVGAIEHVVYEYANLMAAAFYSTHGAPPWRTNCDDAFLLGYRKLGDFLLNDRPRCKDDVLALNYVPAGAPTARTWSLATWTQEWRGQMNKQLTHIAYDRVRHTKEWDHRKWNQQLEREFRDAWKLFLDAVIDVDFKAEYDRQIAHCRAKPGFSSIVL